MQTIFLQNQEFYDGMRKSGGQVALIETKSWVRSNAAMQSDA